eukprot:23031-Pleurochrysis_carterae.AAC.1
MGARTCTHAHAGIRARSCMPAITRTRAFTGMHAPRRRARIRTHVLIREQTRNGRLRLFELSLTGASL